MELCGLAWTPLILLVFFQVVASIFILKSKKNEYIAFQDNGHEPFIFIVWLHGRFTYRYRN